MLSCGPVVQSPAVLNICKEECGGTLSRYVLPSSASRLISTCILHIKAFTLGLFLGQKI